jgi:hypothetical protein
MKITYSVLLLAFLALKLCLPAVAQSYVGNTVDNYGGLHSMLENPANAADSRMRLDINLISTSVFVGNDFISVDLSDLKSFKNGFDFDSDALTNPLDNNKFYGNIDILGPSILFNLNQKSSLAITTRIRGFFNIYNLGGELYQVLKGDLEGNTFNLNMDNFSGVIHAWAEIGVTYGRIIVENNNHLLKAGATLKYLGGAGGLFGFSPQLEASFNSNIYSLTTSGNLNYGYTSGFNSDDITFSNITSGVGADLGLVYELRDNGNQNRTSYKLRFGASVTDFGDINYDGSSNFRYDMNKTINAEEFRYKDFEEVLVDNFISSESVGKSKLGLPTAIRLFVDYPITNKLFVSAQGAISVKEGNELPVSNIINTFTLTPRFETKWISVYSPLSVRKYDSSIAWGFGVRAGPVMIGSGTIFTNLISNSSKSADIYVGIKLPIYK